MASIVEGHQTQGRFKLYVTPEQIVAAKQRLRGPMDMDEAVMMACGDAILAAMGGATLEFPQASTSATPSTASTDSGSSEPRKPRSPGER